MKYGYHSHIQHPLKDEIYKRQMSIDRFANMCNLHKDTLKAIIAGRTKNPVRSTIELIADGLQMSYKDIEEICGWNR